MNNYHKPVLLKTAIDLLQIKPGEKYIDATLGGGGHTQEILLKGGNVLGIDLDQDALDYVGKNFQFPISNFQLTLAKGNFRDIEVIAHLKNFEKVSGILFDLGVSSHQIEIPERGFSFLREGPLDMRLDTESSVTAEYLINLLRKEELYEIFKKYGQDTYAKAIANTILVARRVKAIQTTSELADVVAKAHGIRGEVSDFLKNKINQKVFQALRIAVNNELENIEEALPKALTLLESKGRIVVISFHSLEDKIVKKMFLSFEKQNMGKIITDKPLTAGNEEIKQNSRSKSAKLRVFEKI